MANEAYQDSNELQTSLCQRWEGEDAKLVCRTWGNVFLCIEWEDIIHSFGAYDSHDRVDSSKFNLSSTENAKIFEIPEHSKVETNGSHEQQNFKRVDSIENIKNYLEVNSLLNQD